MSILFPKVGIHKKTVQAVGSYVNGIWQDGTEITTTFTADIQPMTSREISNLSIGSMNLGKIKIYTNDDLNIMGDGNNQKGDIITWDGDGNDYEVISCDSHTNNLLSHKKYIAELRVNKV